MTLLRCEDVSLSFGGLRALDGVTLDVGEWEITGLIGPNGAGKTTLFNCVNGFYRPEAGRVLFDGRDITGMLPHRRAELGLGRSFQQVGLVRSMTVEENLVLGQHKRAGYAAVTGALARPAVASLERGLRENAREILAFLGLEHLKDTPLSDLPYGTLRIVELGQVLATDPRLVLLDEPSSGLGPRESEDLGEVIVRLRDELRLTVLLIEHHVPLVTQVCDYVYVLNFGRVLADGEPQEIQKHPQVIAAYLGEERRGARRKAKGADREPLLRVRGLKAGYGALPVLHDIDLEVAEGETAVVLGLNGAGKTTLLRTIAGSLPATDGEVLLGDDPMHSLPAPERVKRGIALVPEGRHVFADLTVEQNLELGAWTRAERPTFDDVYDLFGVLADRRGQRAGTLSGGEQQMLAIARGLMSRPRLLLLDEASLGLAPVVVHDLLERIRRIAESGVTVLLVEQGAAALDIADRAFVLEKGRIVYSGSGDELARRSELQATYLGAPATGAQARTRRRAERSA